MKKFAIVAAVAALSSWSTASAAFIPSTGYTAQSIYSSAGTFATMGAGYV